VDGSGFDLMNFADGSLILRRTSRKRRDKLVYDQHILLIVGTFAILPDNLAAVRLVINQMVRSSQAEDRCEEYVYAEDLFEPGLIHVKDLWHDQSPLDLHFASGHLAE
jgi:quinol monooxygenase YgiN